MQSFLRGNARPLRRHISLDQNFLPGIIVDKISRENKIMDAIPAGLPGPNAFRSRVWRQGVAEIAARGALHDGLGADQAESGIEPLAESAIPLAG